MLEIFSISYKENYWFPTLVTNVVWTLLPKRREINARGEPQDHSVFLPGGTF
jgi:hypothetical protein